jgi:hypothetical protein
MAETEGVNELNLKRDDLGWEKHHESFKSNFGEFDPYEDFKFAYKLDSGVRAKPIWVVAKPDFEVNLELVSAQIAPASAFLHEIVGDTEISIIRVCPTSPEDQMAYLRYGTTQDREGLLFSERSLQDIVSEPQVVQAAIVHELVHDYLEYQECPHAFGEALPILTEICYLALNKQRPRILEGKIVVDGEYKAPIAEAVEILKKRFGLSPELSSLQVFDWLKTEVSRGEITSLLKDEIQKLL